VVCPFLHVQVKLQISAYPDVAFMALKCRHGPHSTVARCCLWGIEIFST